MTKSSLARRNTLYDPAGPQPDLDAAVLQMEASNRGYCRHCSSYRSHGLSHLRVVTGRQRRCMESCAVSWVVELCYLLECQFETVADP